MSDPVSGGGGSSQEPADGAAKDRGGKDGAAKDRSGKDGAVKDGGVKDSVGTEAAAEPGGAEGAARRLNAAASSPGTSDDDLAIRRRAHQRLRVGAGSTVGDVFQGDKFVIHAGPGGGLAYTRLLEEVVGEVEAFVEPSAYQRIAQFANGRSVVILTGAAGSGKYATALRLIADKTGRRLVHLLKPDTDFAAVKADSLPSLSGIILEDITEAAAARLDDFTLRQLTDTLVQAGQRLVITASDTVSWKSATVAAHCIEIGAAAEPEQVVEQWLRWRLRPAGAEKAAALLDREDVRALIADKTGVGCRLAQAATLGQRLAEAADDPSSAAEHVKARLDSLSEADFVAWFEDLGSTELQCYAIALAVLSGLSNEKVSDAAKRLETHLAPETAEARDAQRPKLFGSGASARLGRLRAERVPQEGTAPGSAQQAMVIEYRNPSYPRQILDFVWQEYDEVRNGLIDWLGELGGHPLNDVRVSAGAAAGLLAQRAWEHVYQTIILPWARSEDMDERDAAAVAMQTAADHPEFASRVKDRLRAWADTDPDADVQLQATAARAYGAEYGAQRKDEALEILGALALVQEVDVIIAVARSLSELIATRSDDLTERVLGLLVDWVRSRKGPQRAMGRFAFVYAAQDLEWREPTQDGGIIRRPALLLFDEDPRYADEVQFLWRAALCSTDLYRWARSVLTAWARSEEPDEQRRMEFARMVARLSADERTGLVLRRLVQEWAGRDKVGPAPQIAALLGAQGAKGSVYAGS